MNQLYSCLGIAAPYYNLALVLVLVALFIYLFRLPNKHNVYCTSWNLLFYALLIFIGEEILTVLRSLRLTSFPGFIFGLLEMAMITLFIYMCLNQKEHLKNKRKTGR